MIWCVCCVLYRAEDDDEILFAVPVIMAPSFFLWSMSPKTKQKKSTETCCSHRISRIGDLFFKNIYPRRIFSINRKFSWSYTRPFFHFYSSIYGSIWCCSLTLVLFYYYHGIIYIYEYIYRYRYIFFIFQKYFTKIVVNKSIIDNYFFHSTLPASSLSSGVPRPDLLLHRHSSLPDARRYSWYRPTARKK